MSGIEVVGLVFGAFALSVSAMEHSERAKRAAKTFWMIERAHQKDYWDVRWCQTMYILHLEKLLRPFAVIEIDGDPQNCENLLKDPEGPLWKHPLVEKALEARMRNHYQTYKNSLKELQSLMVQLAKETKVDDAQFQQYLASQEASTRKRPMIQRANEMVHEAAFQARRLKYSLSSRSREDLLLHVRRYITDLQDLLAAVDGLSDQSSEQNVTRGMTMTKSAFNFWRHAERMYRLLRASMSCNCRNMHCARVWLIESRDFQIRLRLFLQYAKHNQQQSISWVDQPLEIRHVEEPKTATAIASSHSTTIGTSSANIPNSQSASQSR